MWYWKTKCYLIMDELRKDRALRWLTTYTFQATKTQIFFSALYSKNFDDISNFQNAPQPWSKPITTHFVLSHHVRLKVVTTKFPHHVIFLCFLVVHFLLFTSQPTDINFFTTFELLFYFLLIHRAQGCQDWLNTAG